MSLSLSVVRHLDRLTTGLGLFALVAADHRQSLRRLISPGNPDAVSNERLADTKRDIVATLSPHCSGLMIDPELAAIPAVQLGELNPRAGLIVTSEADGYQAIHEGTPATLLEGWRLEYSRMLAADAVKVLVQYPREPGELREREVAFVDAVAGQCRSLQLAFVLEVLVPERVGSDPDIHCSIVVQAARELSGRCDVYKTQFPYPGGAGAGDAQSLNSCLALNAACSAPWVILSGGVDPPEFERQVRLACAAGASGFLAGRSIWEDGARASEAGERRRLLEAIAVPRLRRLTAVAEAWGTPWRARLTEELASMPTTGPHWFERQDAFEQERRP